MNKRTVAILMINGYRIYRSEITMLVDRQCQIYSATAEGGWEVFGNYKSKAERERALEELKKNDKNLID